MNKNQTMMIVSSNYKEQKTIRLIPTSVDCPYVECIFIPDAKSLVVLNKHSKEEFHMLPRLNADGEPEMKAGKAGKESANPFKQQRMNLSLNFEYYVEKVEEIKTFIDYHAFNYDKSWESRIDELTTVEEVVDVDEKTVEPVAK